MVDKKWLHIYLPKGDRKKRAHKKHLKKTGVWQYLRELEIKLQLGYKELYEQEVSQSFKDLTLFGYSEIRI